MAKSQIFQTTKIGSIVLSTPIGPYAIVTYQENIGFGWTHGLLFIRNPLEDGIETFKEGGIVHFDTSSISIGDISSMSVSSGIPASVLMSRPKIFWNNISGSSITSDIFLGTRSGFRMLRVNRIQIIGENLELEFKSGNALADTINADIRYRLFKDIKV